MEGVWDGGLEDWWRSLPDDQSFRRKLLFRLWGATAELSSDEAWRNLNARCVRSVIGEWVSMLRLRRQQGSEYPFLSQAWGWIDNRARSISLREILEHALNALISSTDPDRSVLVPFGHWAKHRNRADLLTHVLVQSDGDQLGVPVGEALLADPYVDHGQERRYLFSDIPVIAGVYMETDPKSAGAHEWRTFFEEAGVKGGVEVKDSRKIASRSSSKDVAEFLGHGVDAIPVSNNRGYTLLDFDVEPSLPSPGATRELRAAVAPWLEDGFRVLKDKGRRKALYTYYTGGNIKGNKPSAWVAKLSKLAWVPSSDEELRYPRDVLKDFDPARQDAPIAMLQFFFVTPGNNDFVVPIQKLFGHLKTDAA